MLLPGSRLAVFFRVRTPMGDLIDSLEGEAAAVGGATFASITRAHGIKDEVTFRQGLGARLPVWVATVGACGGWAMGPRVGSGSSSLQA